RWRRRDVERDHLERQVRFGRGGTQGRRLVEIAHAGEDAEAVTRQTHAGCESDAGAGAGDDGDLHARSPVGLAIAMLPTTCSTPEGPRLYGPDRKSTRLNSSH